MSRNILISASAGAGKTFQLSNRYLDLAFEGVPLDAVLASTFTRKAAGEILGRILQRLAQAALDEKKREELAHALHGESGKTLSRETVLKILTQSVRNLHRLRVATLDSFFIQIAGSYSLELGIPPGWSIVEELDDSRNLGEAIRAVFAQNHTRDTVRLMHLLFKGETSRSITEEVFSLAKNLLSLYRSAPRNAWNRLPRFSELPEEELAEFIQMFKDAPVPSHKTYVKGRDKSWEKALKGDWKEFLADGPPAKVLDGSYTYCTKKIEGEMLLPLEKLVAHAKARLINALAIQTEATGDLLERIDRQYEKIKEENRAYRFEDVTFRLASSQLHDHLEQIVHRIDAPTRHLLLDEFQDTSLEQWDVLKPFVDSVMCFESFSEGSLFCVGDAKQAIYGWRGGVAGIFEKIEREVRPLAKQDLSVNWRSSPVVIETVNEIFLPLCSNDSLNASEDFRDAAVQWRKRFEKHEPSPKNAGRLAGYCTLEVAPIYDPENEDWKRFEISGFEQQEDEETEDSSTAEEKSSGSPQRKLNFLYAAHRIKELHEQAPTASLGVLVRQNKTVGIIIHALKQLGIPASEEGGNPLTDSPAVEMVLSALTLADHPGNKVARFHLLHGPLGVELGITDYADESQAFRASESLRASLMEKGYGGLIGEWIGKIAPCCDRRNLDRLLQLLQIAYSWDCRRTLRSDLFVEMVRKKGLESPSGENVRIMTIHQSKGLEFDIVVLPELDVRLIGQPPTVVLGRKSPETGRENSTAPVDRILRFVKESEQPILPPNFKRMFSEHRREQVEESLCLLYVALTRAVHRLCMIVPPLKKTKNPPSPRKTFDGVLRSVLVSGERAYETEAVLYENGDPDWISYHPEKTIATKSKPSRESMEIRLKENMNPRRNLPRITPSGLEGSQEIDSGDAVFPESHVFSERTENPEIMQSGEEPDGISGRKLARLRGSAIHACFEKGLLQTPWLDRGQPVSENLHPVVRELIYSSRCGLNMEEVVGSFLKICSQSGVKNALSHSGYKRITSFPEDRREVFSEREFLVRCGTGILRGSIDRLVVVFSSGKPVEAEITDFKTDSFNAKNGNNRDRWVREKAAFYGPQLNSYRFAVSKLYGIPDERIRAQLLFTGVDQVHIVEPSKGPY